MSFHHEAERITDKLNKQPLTEQPELVKWANSFLTAKKAEGLAARTIGFYRDKLSGLQRTILRDLECPRQLYLQWIPKSWKPLKI